MPLRKQIWNMITLLVIALLAAILMNFWLYIFKSSPIEDVTSSSWENHNYTTWYIWVIPIQENFIWDQWLTIIENIKQAEKVGKQWQDYISIVPTKQPNIYGGTQNEHNDLIWKYNYKNKYEFTLPIGKSHWYLIIDVNKDLDVKKGWSNGIFLWVWWKTLGMINSKNINENKKRFVFDFKNINLLFPSQKINLFKQQQWGKLQLSACIATQDTYIEKITLVFYEPLNVQ